MEKFVEKSADVLAKMSAEELAGYYNAKNEATSAEIKALKDSAKNAEDVAEELKSKMATLEADKLEQMKSLNDTLKQHGIAIKKLNAQEKEAGEGVVNTIEKGLKDNKEALSGLKGNRSASVSFKAAGTMLISSNVSGGNVPV